MEIMELLYSTRLAADIAVDVVFEGTVLLGAVWLITRLMASRPAAERHAVWTVGFVLALAMPFAGSVLPQRSLALLEYPRDLISMEMSVPTVGAARAGEAPGRALADAEGSAPGAVMGAAPASPGAPAPSSWWERFEAPAAAGFLLLWWVGVLGFSVRIAGHWIRAALITRRGEAVPPDGAPAVMAGTEARRLGIRRRVRVVYSDHLGIPLTWGALRPVLILPSAAASWPEGRLRAVVLHELAHVRRWDFLSHQLAEAARAFYWANPLLWLAGRAAARERERACDDEVLRRGVGPAEYAEILLEMARTYAGLPARVRPGLEGGLAMARPGGLGDRVSDILETATPRRRGRSPVILGASLVLGLVAVPLGSVSLLASAPGTGTVAEMVASLEHGDAAVRLRAVRNLGRWCIGQAHEAVAGALLDDPDPEVRFTAAFALGTYGYLPSLTPLEKALDDEDEDPKVRLMALEMLGRIDTRESAQAVLPYLDHRDPTLRWMAVKSLSKMESQEEWLRPRLGRVLLHDEDERARGAAASALHDDGCDEVVAWLERARSDASPTVRARVEEALRHFGAA